MQKFLIELYKVAGIGDVMMLKVQGRDLLHAKRATTAGCRHSLYFSTLSSRKN